MKKPTDWAKVRAAYEAGETTVAMLAQLHNVKAYLIRERARAEGWASNPAEEALRLEQARKQVAREKRLAAAGALGVMPPEQRAALLHDLLTRYLRGELVGEMKGDLGATRFALYYALLGGADDAAHGDLITQALTARVARADEMLENAQGPVEIARAREMARFFRMDLERRRPALYGMQAKISHTVSFDLGDRLRRARLRTIDAQTVEALPAPAEASLATLQSATSESDPE